MFFILTHWPGFIFRSMCLPMESYSFCITFTPTAYATNDTTIIRHVYKPDFAVCVPFFHDRKLGPVCHQIGGRVRSSFLSGQWCNVIIIIYKQCYTMCFVYTYVLVLCRSHIQIRADGKCYDIILDHRLCAIILIY